MVAAPNRQTQLTILWIITTLILTVSSTSPTYELCDNTIVPGSAPQDGIIHHSPLSVNSNCTLTINKRSDSPVHDYSVIVGVERLSSPRDCKTELININGDPLYCINETGVQIIDGRLHSSLDISAASTLNEFSLQYSTTVFVCNGIVKESGGTIMMGYVTSEPPGEPSLRSMCATDVTALPSNTPVRLELLKYFSTDQTHRIYANRDESNELQLGVPLLVNSSQTGLVFITADYYAGAKEGSLMQFLLKYTVLQCPAPPTVRRGIYPPTISRESPYLPGTKAMYTCEHNYTMKSTGSIQCKVVGTEAEWFGIESVECIPVVCDKDVILNISYGGVLNEKETYWYRDTLLYECSEGYKKSENLDVTCQSDRNWSTIPMCVEATCIPPQIENGYFTMDQNLTSSQRYPYNTTMVLVCHEGFVLDHNVLITCGKYGWSGEIKSCKALRSSRLESKRSQDIIAGAAVSSSVVFLMLVIAVIVVFHKRRTHQNRDTERSRRESVESENPYHILERPEELCSHHATKRLTGPYCDVQLEFMQQTSSLLAQECTKAPVDISTKPTFRMVIIDKPVTDTEIRSEETDSQLITEYNQMSVTSGQPNDEASIDDKGDSVSGT